MRVRSAQPDLRWLELGTRRALPGYAHRQFCSSLVRRTVVHRVFEIGLKLETLKTDDPLVAATRVGVVAGVLRDVGRARLNHLYSQRR